MYRKIFEKLIHSCPEKGNNYLYLMDDQSMSEAVCALGRPAIFISRNDQEEKFFNARTFRDYIHQIAYTGTYLSQYTIVLACKRKSLADDCRALLRDAGISTKDGWKLFRGKDYLSDIRFSKELGQLLTRFEKNLSGPDADDQLKNRFCIIDRNGNCKGIIDKALIDYIMEQYHMFVCMGTLYLYEDGAYTEDTDGIRIKDIMQQYLYISVIRARTLNNLYSLLLMQHSLQRTMDQVNQYPKSWINFKNGMLDTETLELHPHSPAYYSINQIPHSYLAEFLPDRWKETQKFLQFSAPGPEDIRMLLQYLGYCMTIDTRQQVFLMLKGEGGTGKSRVIHLFEYIIGKENVSNIALQDLNKRFYPSALFCKLLNSCADISSAAMEDVDTIKKATGEDILMYEQKGADPRSFTSYAKLMFSANRVPMNLDEKSNAYYRRLLIYEMNKRPSQEDRDLDKKLEAEVEMTINRAVWALHEMYTSESGRILKSENSRRLVNKQRMDADSVEAFLQEGVVRGQGKRILRSALYEAYKAYCEENERICYKKRQFFNSLEERGLRLVKTMGEVQVDGIALKEKTAEEGGFIPVEEYQQETIPFSVL